MSVVATVRLGLHDNSLLPYSEDIGLINCWEGINNVCASCWMFFFRMWLLYEQMRDKLKEKQNSRNLLVSRNLSHLRRWTDPQHFCSLRKSSAFVRIFHTFIQSFPFSLCYKTGGIAALSFQARPNKLTLSLWAKEHFTLNKIQRADTHVKRPAARSFALRFL